MALSAVFGGYAFTDMLCMKRPSLLFHVWDITGILGVAVIVRSSTSKETMDRARFSQEPARVVSAGFESTTFDLLATRYVKQDNQWCSSKQSEQVFVEAYYRKFPTSLRSPSVKLVH